MYRTEVTQWKHENLCRAYGYNVKNKPSRINLLISSGYSKFNTNIIIIYLFACSATVTSSSSTNNTQNVTIVSQSWRIALT